jgi:signal transduction histidine kinase
VVRGYISMMEEGSFGPLPAEVETFLPTLVSRAGQMNQLIEQMLMTARLEDRRMVLNMSEVRVDQLVGGLIGSLDGLKRPTHSLVFEQPDHPVVAWADAEKVETILTNLLSNALKYSPRGGEVRVTARSLDQQVIVAVHDQGIGIAAEHQTRLFERFGRIEGPETSNIEGTGLGLFLSRELARLQGGNIAVASEEGRGSVFTLTLPATMPEPAVVAGEASLPDAEPAGDTEAAAD